MLIFHGVFFLRMLETCVYLLYLYVKVMMQPIIKHHCYVTQLDATLPYPSFPPTHNLKQPVKVQEQGWMKILSTASSKNISGFNIFLWQLTQF